MVVDEQGRATGDNAGRVHEAVDTGDVDAEEDAEAELGELLYTSMYLQTMTLVLNRAAQGTMELTCIHFLQALRHRVSTPNEAACPHLLLHHEGMQKSDIPVQEDAGCVVNGQSVEAREVLLGTGVVATAMTTKDLVKACENVVGSILQDGSITSAFACKTLGVSYSHRPFTATKTRTECVLWAAESLRPFHIIKDRAFLSLMKTSHPGMFIPSPSTISRDTKVVFARTQRRVAHFLRVRQPIPPHIKVLDAYRSTAILWETELHDRHMVIAESPHICHYLCPLQTEGEAG